MPLSLLSLSAVLFLFTGCVSDAIGPFDSPGDELKRFPSANAETTLSTLYKREAAVTSLRANGTLTIEENERRVRLDAILLSDRLDTPTPRIRLRSSKFGTSVMDLVRVDRTTWFWVKGDDAAFNEQAEASLLRLPPLQLRHYELDLDHTTPSHFVFNAVWHARQPTPAQASVHRSTRTLHRVVFSPANEPTELALRYKPSPVGPQLEAMRVVAPNGTTVTLSIEQMQINPPLIDGVFRPLPQSRRIDPSSDP
ncbi:MAG: hypothetical protein ACPGYV_08785 [Phycisphaeraceae bacterium]